MLCREIIKYTKRRKKTQKEEGKKASNDKYLRQIDRKLQYRRYLKELNYFDLAFIMNSVIEIGGAWHVVRNEFDRNVKSQTLKCQNIKQ